MLVRLALAAAIVLCNTTLALAASFSVTSPAFPDGGKVPVSASQPNCGGGTQTSPPLALANVPDATKSFAVVVMDTDTNGPTFVHWVAYGFPGSTRAIAAGAGAQPPVGGTNGAGEKIFHGLCPPAGQTPHHYVISVYATDLAPDALAPGLTKDQLFAALKGHVLAAQSIVGTYGQP